MAYFGHPWRPLLLSRHNFSFIWHVGLKLHTQIDESCINFVMSEHITLLGIAILDINILLHHSLFWDTRYILYGRWWEEPVWCRWHLSNGSHYIWHVSQLGAFCSCILLQNTYLKKRIFPTSNLICFIIIPHITPMLA